MTDYFTGDDRSNRERMLAGDWYVSDDPESWDQFKRAVRLQTRYTAAYAEDPDAARPILEELLGHLGEEAHVRPPLFVDYGSYISVGARTFINYNLTALDVAPIVIGEDCQIGPNVQLLTPVHPLEAQPRKDRLEAARPITIEVLRLARRRSDHLPRREHRRRQRHRCRGRRNARHPAAQPRRRLTGTGHPRAVGKMPQCRPTMGRTSGPRRYAGCRIDDWTARADC